jgi:RimJ/RimL family protein N-acetyltransferase
MSFPSFEITLRPAQIEDADRLLEWRNDPETRKFSIHQGEVSHEEHARWLSDTLRREDRILLIAREGVGEFIGVIRFDLSESRGDAEVSITISPGARGKGLSAKLLQCGIDYLFDKHDHSGISADLPLKARIRVENVASIKCFSRVGFKVDKEDHGCLFLSYFKDPKTTR